MVEDPIKSVIQLGKLSTLRPVVNFAHFATVPSGTNWGPRTISDCQLIHVVSGTAEIYLNGQKRSLFSGDSVFYGTNSPHQIVVPLNKDFTFYSIHFAWDSESAEPIHPFFGLKDCSFQDLESPALTYSVQVDRYGSVNMPHYFHAPKIENWLDYIIREYQMVEPGYTFVLRGLMHMALMEILRGVMTPRTNESPQSKKIASILETIQKEPARNWSIEQLARMGSYHPTYFASIFKEVMGHAPKHYLVLERMRLAKTLLLELDTVEEVADQLNYASLHYFSRHFKEITGFTPSEFKKRSAFL